MKEGFLITFTTAKGKKVEFYRSPLYRKHPSGFRRGFCTPAKFLQLLREHKFVSWRDYAARYEKFEDKLPSNPTVTYGENLRPLICAIFKENREEKILLPTTLTVERLKQIVKDMEICSQVEYAKRYKECPGLPSNPWDYFRRRGVVLRGLFEY
ncbi:hypothetical protein H6775_02980 [Candidatus Nomurabacteria bacterium]|nr:hypothetical protein [Candidatus Nomurabacteria bacterium]